MITQVNISPTKIEPIHPPEKAIILEVTKDLQVIEIKKRTGQPFFLATLFIPEMLWTTRINDLDEVFDNYVRYKAGNSTRVFLFPSSWDAKYNRWATDIFLRDDNGKFMLPEPNNADKLIGHYIHPIWEAQVIDRIQTAVRRKIMLIISLWDNCSFHRKSPGFWSANFLNPNCNNIKTSGQNHSYYEYASDISNLSQRLQNTGKIVEALTRYMLNTIYDNLTPRERKYIAIETCNEGQSGTAWHMRMKDIIDETWGSDCPRWRRFTSTQASVSTKTRRYFTPVTHQIGNMESYLAKELDVYRGRHGISTDGWHEPGLYSDVPIPVQRAKRLLKRAYRDGLVLMEMLHGHRHIHQRIPKSPYNTTKNRKWYDHSVIKWREMRQMGKTLLRLTK